MRAGDKVSIIIPTVTKEIQVYKIKNKHFICIDACNKVVRLCIEELEISSLTIALLCKWIDKSLNENKK